MATNSYTKKDILALAQKENVHFVLLQFTDILGRCKNVQIPRTQLEKALDNQIMIDGSSIEGYARIHESDMFLRPDLSTWCVLPWCRVPRKVTARLICDVVMPNGEPFLGDPRNVLRRALKKAEDMGYRFNVGPECEFFLFETDEKGNPTHVPADQADYFDLAPVDHSIAIRDEICLTLEEMNFEIEASHHEGAPGQQEIDFKYAEALRAADDIMSFKQVVKTIAQRNGLHATFMPKPIEGINGSGMHVNMSLFNKNGKNVFYDENGHHRLSKEAYSFIAGILEHVAAITAISNPLVNSYKRLVPGYEAPCYVAWSAHNRSSLVRIPTARGQSTRVELRSPDPACNPYLTLAMCLTAGLDGIERGLTPMPEVSENIYLMDAETRYDSGIQSLPGNLEDAILALDKDDLLIAALGEHTYNHYRVCKMKEWDEYRKNVSEWERDKYLVNY